MWSFWILVNEKYAEVIASHTDQEERNRGVIGDDFKAEKTGKDSYANARNKVALKDESYKPVATAAAEAKLLQSFMSATEIVEASKWLEETALEAEGSDEAAKLIKLLGPSDAQVSSAKTFVEKIKEVRFQESQTPVIPKADRS